MISGGENGIIIPKGDVKRIIGHTHPYGTPSAGASDFDIEALQALGQKSSYVIENGMVAKFHVRE